MACAVSSTWCFLAAARSASPPAREASRLSTCACIACSAHLACSALLEASAAGDDSVRCACCLSFRTLSPRRFCDSFRVAFCSSSRRTFSVSSTTSALDSSLSSSFSLLSSAFAEKAASSCCEASTLEVSSLSRCLVSCASCFLAAANLASAPCALAARADSRCRSSSTMPWSSALRAPAAESFLTSACRLPSAHLAFSACVRAAATAASACCLRSEAFRL
mmetsp:Transcript_106600/g.229553  ORF Transcript_106600/g.229553 Transcript_106600/m.229553 type:complete len:221 (-) Transcript_106600:130-792(-)